MLHQTTEAVGYFKVEYEIGHLFSQLRAGNYCHSPMDANLITDDIDNQTFFQR